MKSLTLQDQYVTLIKILLCLIFEQGAESQHNYSYWRGEQYIGIGPGIMSKFTYNTV